ncbi:hypothetical protein [Mucilaginibacter psychrotolerans]|uniref:Uncharacterized protein n=1 Tax=Mucilaginibacter psychrotolerans TaxID=1524096 RepID=A0A4Y8SCY0_9SPHI|nr:hypothetical protein [Mucilaginibacter psychrotolerans]TFF36889.1 hypothetical protein E2R66_14090 [Mucilaginibacter psychrotolerans]
MKLYFLIIFTCLTYFAQAQKDDDIWKTWNKNYPKEDIPTMLKKEREYAISVEKNPNEAPDYLRRASYRFKASFLGKAKPVDAETIESMQWVLKFTGRDPSVIIGLIDSVVLMKVGAEEIWMPIQRQLLPQLREEVLIGEEVTLYCLFLNHHTNKNKLFNNFLISEFIPEKDEY